MLDNALIRKITNHLREPHLRISRISEQIPIQEVQDDNIYNEQVFDEEGYEEKNNLKEKIEELEERQLLIQESLQEKNECLLPLFAGAEETK